MNTSIYIENHRADITADLAALLTFSIDDVNKFASRNTSFSKTIVLPGTKLNNVLFGHIYEVNAGKLSDSTQPNVGYNFNAAKGARTLIINGNFQVFKGEMRLTEIIIDKGSIEYEVAVFGELGGFVSELGNTRLEDLDFSAYDQSYSITNIVNSWDNTPGTGIYYPLIDYGNFSTGTYGTIKHDWQFSTFRPALYVKEYIDKIFEATNYTYECDLFETDRFKRLIVPYNKKALEMLVTQVLSASRSSSSQVLNSGTAFSVALQMNSVVGTNFTATNSNSRFTYNNPTPLTATFTFSGNGSYIGNNTGYSIYVSKTSGGVTTVITGTTMTYLETNDTSSHPYGYSSSVTLSLNQNDYIEVFVEASDPLTGTDSMVVSNFVLSANSTTPVFAQVTLGDFLTINSTIPRGILAKDFFSSILKLFNLYVYEDRDNERKLKIAPFVDFYDLDPANAVDWTYKLNRDKPIRLKPLSEMNSRFYEFKYKQDNDYYNEEYRKRYNENYGDRIYDSEFEFAEEKSTAQIIFSGTPLVGYAGEDKVYSTIFKRSGTVEENIDSNIRILQTKKITGVSSWDIMDAGTVLGSYTVYGYAGHLDDPDAPTNDVNFGVPKELFFTLASGDLTVNQFSVYWSSYLAEITDKDSKLLTANLVLNSKDIHNLDFSKLIWIDGGLFRLNKLEDWNANDSVAECKGELLKVINLDY